MLSQNLAFIILLIVVVSCILGLFLIGKRLYKALPLSKTQRRISRFVKADFDKADLEECLTHSNQDSLLPSTQDIGRFRDRINKSLPSLSSEKIQRKLSSAYWAITDTEYNLIRLMTCFTALLAGLLLFNNILGSIFLVAIAIMVPPLFLERAISQRQSRFQTQLLDVLILIKGAVQAGYGLMQALDLAVKEIPAPASEEFSRLLHENRLGISLEGALNNLADRMESDDLQIVVTAIIINAQVGGNLSTVLEAAISTIRDRMHLLGEIQSLTSYARYVGNFLTLLPFVTGLGIFLMSPDYFNTFKTSIITQGIFVLAILGVVIGNVWIRQIVRIRV